MERENCIEMSRPKAFRRLNLESSLRSSSQVNSRTSGENTSMSPMTNLVHNLSGASLDSTPKRKPSASLQGNVFSIDTCLLAIRNPYNY